MKKTLTFIISLFVIVYWTSVLFPSRPKLTPKAATVVFAQTQQPDEDEQETDLGRLNQEENPVEPSASATMVPNPDSSEDNSQEATDFLLDQFLATDSAQTATDSTQATGSAVVLQKERLLEQIEDQKQTLIQQLAQYEQLQRQFRIANNQVEQLQTLASIREAVAAAKKLLLARNQVLSTYFRLMQLKIIDAEGIELTHKRSVLAKIEEHQQQLLVFETEIRPVQDRIELNQRADQFVEEIETMRETANYILTLLSLGELQAVYDQSQILKQEIISMETAGGLLKQARLNQSVSEIDRLSTTVKSDLDEQWQELTEAEGKRKGYSRFYTSSFTDFNSIYSQLSQLTSYLGELYQLNAEK